MADRELVDAVLGELYQALLRPPLDDLNALTEAQRRVESLQEQYGGRPHYWPKPDKEQRNIRIASELKSGKSLRAVAAVHGVSQATVHSVKKRTEQEDGGFGSKDWNIE